MLTLYIFRVPRITIWFLSKRDFWLHFKKMKLTLIGLWHQFSLANDVVFNWPMTLILIGCNITCWKHCTVIYTWISYCILSLNKTPTCIYLNPVEGSRILDGDFSNENRGSSFTSPNGPSDIRHVLICIYIPIPQYIADFAIKYTMGLFTILRFIVELNCDMERST